MVSITDKFGRPSAVTGYAKPTTVRAARLANETTLSAYDLSGYDDTTPLYFVTYRKTTEVNPDTGLQEEKIVNQVSFKGIVSLDNNTITDLEVSPGYTDVGNEVGDYIESVPTSHWGNDLVEGLLVSHNPDGTLPANSVNGQAIADGSVTSEKIDFSTGIWWEEIGRVELSTASSSANIAITPKKFMRIIATIRVASGSSINVHCRVNNDSGSNYTGRYIGIGNTGALSGTVSGLLGQLAAVVGLSTGNTAQFDFSVSRVSTASPLIGTGSTSSIGSSTPGSERLYTTTSWNNTTTAVSSINFSTSAGSMTGTFVVLGHN